MENWITFYYTNWITEKHSRKEGLTKRCMNLTEPKGKARTVSNSTDDF